MKPLPPEMGPGNPSVKLPPPEMGPGNPSAILGTDAIVRNKAIVAIASISLFTVLLLCERVRTVIECRRRDGFSNLIFARFQFGNCKFDEA